MLQTSRVLLFTSKPERATACQLFTERRKRLCPSSGTRVVDSRANAANRIGQQPPVAITGDACGVDIVVAGAGRDQCR